MAPLKTLQALVAALAVLGLTHTVLAGGHYEGEHCREPAIFCENAGQSPVWFQCASGRLNKFECGVGTVCDKSPNSGIYCGYPRVPRPQPKHPRPHHPEPKHPEPNYPEPHYPQPEHSEPHTPKPQQPEPHLPELKKPRFPWVDNLGVVQDDTMAVPAVV
ncbi:hypothetical protein IWQ60_001640 [Tieghemiomyces parasiticus]|uniref:Uncharacterized protein n=1 Tax=Tieghemiomyces parasiticus TaxID=78921 RepID=A0A9W8ADS6_9FUNG|nr:hypothetical protein IWQ60_001640 [Tieghemiomyces parasiticus]